MTEEDLPTWVTVSFSGGKDSTAMLLRMIEIGDHIDEVINIDTGMEFPSMYEHIERVRKIVENAGIKFTVLKAPHSFEYYMFDHEIKSKKYGDHQGYGFPSPVIRWCTKHLKLEPLRQYLKQYQGKYKIISCIGLASDELKRLVRPNNMKPGMRHPLVDWGWSEKDCLQYCLNLGFDWGGLYDVFSRVSCWCCPLASLSELRTLYRNYPDLWTRLQEMEDRLKGKCVYGDKFTREWSVRELGIRFEKELNAERNQTHLDEWV